LSEDEAARRLARDGPNTIALAPPEAAWRIILRQFQSVVAGLLLAGVALSMLSGDHADAVAIAVVLLINGAIGAVMELKARDDLHSLRSLQTPAATVMRDGLRREIDSREIVVGDVLLLEEGWAIPADARLLRSSELRTGEASLTGESVPVQKDAGAVIPAGTAMPDRTTMIWNGTALLSGAGEAVVVATGNATQLGRIGVLARSTPTGSTGFERQVDALGRQLALIALVLAAMVVGLGWLHGLAPGLLAQLGIALAVAAVPEGLPVVATIALARGVLHMARRRAILRNLPSVSGLGAATVVCTDKTGTLTAGEMTVVSMWADGVSYDVTGVGFAPTGTIRRRAADISDGVPGELGRLLRAAALASRATVREEGGQWRAVGDPTDAALVVAAHKAGVQRQIVLEEEPLAWETPFSSVRRESVSAHRSRSGIRQYAKGAVSVILDSCNTSASLAGDVPLGAERRAAVLAANDEMAARGLRVVAIAEGSGGETPAIPANLVFLGLAAIADPLSPAARDTIQGLKDAGIRTVMITGDQRFTAQALARELGMVRDDADVLDARELEQMSDAELDARVGTVSLYSRIAPEDKLRIVASLQRRGESVAMLGDGVNDAAALRQADVGVAMGRRGTDVARDAADLVLADDQLATVVAAVEEGRTIGENMRKVVFFIVSCNVAELVAIAGTLVLGFPTTFAPLQILWLNLLTDTIPALALATEPPEPDLMRRPPRAPSAPLLSRRMRVAAMAYAALIALVSLSAYALWYRSHDAESALTVAFITLAMAQVLHLGNARSRRPVLRLRAAVANRAALAAVAICILLLVGATYVRPVAAVLRLRDPGLAGWAMALLFAAIPALVGQAARSWPRARATS
jgi:Ca2+-transporting ATPase